MGIPYKAETPRLYHNNPDGTFTDVTRHVRLGRAILAMGAGFGGLDNDGWLDIYLGTGSSELDALLPNHMFRNDAGRKFQDVNTSGGFGHLQKGHAVASGDINNDGHEDIFEEIGGALPGDTYQGVLFANLGHDNHWLTLELEGVQTNRSTFGARLAVTLKMSEGNAASIARSAMAQALAATRCGNTREWARLPRSAGGPCFPCPGRGQYPRTAQLQVISPPANCGQTELSLATCRQGEPGSFKKARNGDPQGQVPAMLNCRPSR
jgi:hypothetical protein